MTKEIFRAAKCSKVAIFVVHKSGGHMPPAPSSYALQHEGKIIEDICVSGLSSLKITCAMIALCFHDISKHDPKQVYGGPELP